MGVTNYDTINGRIVGENTNGVQTDYMRDALGSVTGTTVAGGCSEHVSV
jgi:YD repeat-containing protein